jgi:hypothetical protein
MVPTILVILLLTLKIKIMNIEKKVMDLLSRITLDLQFNKNSVHYCGFLNCSIDGFNILDHKEAFKDLCNRPKYYACLMNISGLTTEDGFNLDETIFIKQ